MKQAILFLLLVSAPATASDDTMWESLHVEAVTSYGCNINQATVSGIVGEPTDHWMTDAWAKRRDMPDWAMALGYFPSNSSGRSKAMRDCDNWMKKVEKRIREPRHDNQWLRKGVGAE